MLFLEDELTPVIEVSALNQTHLKTLLDEIFERLPKEKPL